MHHDTHRGDAAAYGLAALLSTAGILHFARPQPFAAIAPTALGGPLPWVYLSGGVELACAAGLLSRRTRRASAWGCVGLFVAVFPANVQMALDAGDRSAGYRALTYARLPLQIPLILWAATVARRAQGVRTGHR